MTLRLALAGGFALAGLIAAAPAIKGVCLGLAVLSFVVIPVLGDRLLSPIEAEVSAANRSDASKLLKDIEERWAVRWFAPSAWLAVQQARLQLSSGDPRAAAMSYFEARRASSLGASRPELTSAEADAHLHADDRKQALKLLRELEEKKSLAPLDHVNFGVALLSESGQSEAARDHFEKAYKALNEEPRVVAGLALARQRCGDLEGARELLDGDLELDRSEDRTARDLAKRARKGLKGKGGESKSDKKKKKKKKDKKGSKPSESEAEVAKTESPAPAASPSEAKPAKSKKKDKKKKKDKPKGKKARRAARREARKKKEAEERAAKAAEREKAEREALEKQQQERERAAAKAKRASQVKTIPAETPLTAPVSVKPKPVVPKAPAAASGSIGGAKPIVPAAPKSPAPPKANSLFGSMFAPPKLGSSAAAPKPAAPKPAAPKPTVSKPVASKPAAPKPVASKPAAPVVPPPVAAKAPTPPPVAAPSLDDLFAPPAAGSGPSIPAPPSIGAPPMVPPPPISAPKTSAPPKLDDWGSDLGLPAAPVIPPPVAKPKTDDEK
jgi:hypothetical protein